MARDQWLLPPDVRLPLPAPLPQGPRIPVDERLQRAMLPTATRLGTAQGPTSAVRLPSEVQALLRTHPRALEEVEAAEERAAEAAARAVDQVWAEALARLQALYGAESGAGRHEA